MNDLEEFRTRWKRWLGQKCRKDSSAWTTLYQSNWHSWASEILDRSEILSPLKASVRYPDREQIKKHFSIAIGLANIGDLLRLDNLYCTEIAGL